VIHVRRMLAHCPTERKFAFILPMPYIYTGLRARPTIKILA
jgi:hypothetical protein